MDTVKEENMINEIMLEENIKEKEENEKFAVIVAYGPNENAT